MFGDLDPIAEHPGYRDRDARLRLLDEQGMDGALLFPTLGVGMQEALRARRPGAARRLRARSTTGSTRTGASTAATAGSTPRR